jgi:hypothetical protein
MMGTQKTLFLIIGYKDYLIQELYVHVSWRYAPIVTLLL